MNYERPSSIRSSGPVAIFTLSVVIALLLSPVAAGAQQPAQPPAQPTPVTPPASPAVGPVLDSGVPPFVALGAPKISSVVTFNFEKAGLEVPRFSLTVQEDGSALYAGDQIVPNSDPALPVLQHAERKVALSPAATMQIFAAAQALNHFNVRCSSGAKGIADTGRKTLAFTGLGGNGICVYNYSQDKRVVELTDLFEGIGTTIAIGRKLDFDHRFDRLGLDAATTSLEEANEAGRAVELGTISSTLKSIAQDTDVMERVRLRAAKLLKKSEGS